ncbi:sensor histidine kinase [Arcobacter sp. LA11]|uniref:sensor histidine kinase n=1 Tax=Arcobacter sp. LA11 TaxID=1898176 RepID=UPI00093464A3|nr:histidine kinase dimerization/phosphoacceptor domain -containing protein [Arcobacter sp. LA11]
MSTPKSYSLNTKITLTFTILGLVLLAILFIQIIPNMQDEQKEYKKNQIEHMITLTNQQIKLGVQLLIHEKETKTNEIESFLKTRVNEFLKNVENEKNIELKNLSDDLKCKIYIVDNHDKTLYSSHNNSLLINKELLKNDKVLIYRKKQEHMCPKRAESIFYSRSIKEGKETLVTKCEPKAFKNRHENLEENIKQDLQKSFDLTYKDHKGKINLIWINTRHEDVEDKPLYNSKDKPYNNKYCLSKMSSSDYPQTGLLSAKQILEAANKEPIYHLLDSKDKPFKYTNPALTWVRIIQDKRDRKLLFLTTVYLEDFNREFYSPLLKIFPAAILSLLLAIFLGFFLFKRLFKSINILTNTAKEIDNGNINLRSEIEGNDDIAVLAKTFDSMLDSIEKNINELDKKVEGKTKELRSSLEEKETLLKEIHHRVKNNLAMTINLIKLQKSKIEDEKTKNTLTDIQERIFTMELLHRKLYESKDLNSIPFKKYVLELIEDLDSTYGRTKDIKINSFIDDINMNIEYALPCGLIITELITNAYKYGFVDAEGKLEVFFVVDNNKCTLSIKDNGKGLPSSIDIKKVKSLGLKLVSTIVKGQLFGKFDYRYDNGSKFIIQFKL